jgi:hypothetical protein
MKMKHIKLFAVVMLSGLVIAGCKKKDDDDDNEEELITTVKVTLTPVAGGASATYTWKDVDGAGGNTPVIDTIRVSPSLMYNCSVQFIDESKSPAEDITPEIVAEANDHQVYYLSTGPTINVTGFNNDGRGLPLGTTSVWTTGVAGTGNMNIILVHKPGIKAAGDLISVGEIDIEIVFPVRIQ